MGLRPSQSGCRRLSGVPLLQLALLVSFVLLPPSQPAHAFGMRPHRAAHAEQQQVIQVDDQIRMALLAGDATALEKILADDFLGISSNGTFSDKPQYLRRVSKHEYQFSRIDITDRKIRLRSSSAVVITTAQIAGKLESTPVNGLFRYTRVYSREADGTWHLRNFEATRVSGSGADEMRHGVPIGKVR